MKKLGFIGLGKMGLPMSRRLKDKYDLVVYNRTASVAEELGTEIASTPAELTSQVDRIVIILSDDDACEQVFFGEKGIITSKNKPLLINMSTISPQASIFFKKKFNSEGFNYIEAPVLGSVGPATQGTLVILAAGEALDLAEDLFNILGRATYSYPEVGMAARVKLLINTNLGVQMAILAETMVAAEKLGLSAEQFLEVVNDSAVKTIVSQFKGKNLLEDNYPTAFPYKHLLKDLRYSVDASTTAGARADISSRVRDIFAEGNDYFELDFSAIKKVYC